MVNLKGALFALSLLAGMSGSSGLAAPAVQNREIEGMRGRLFPELSKLDAARLPKQASGAIEARSKRRAACALEPVCTVTAGIWTEAEIAAVEIAAGSDTSVRQAIRTELLGVNTILQVYGLGTAPLYPEIDGPELARPDQFKATVGAAVRMAASPPLSLATELDPSITLSLALMDAADRLDPVRLEPTSKALNAPAVARASRVDWRAFPYTAILALGVGPNDLQTPLSALGKLNMQTAANLFHEGQAPFIIVSGGAVHPRRTPHVEAFEMRKALIERFSVPPEAIIVDPFARHTTTNLRNASRLLVGIGAPQRQEAVVVSNEAHITYVLSPVFKKRNLDALGYMPVVLGRRLSPTSLTFTPDVRSRLVDPRDPLDP
jgi:hypothetical protein